MSTKTGESPVHNIVILGGSYSGLKVAHGILKAIPAITQKTDKHYKVTVISFSTHHWFSVGAPRAMFQPYPKSNMDSFTEIKPGFAKYPAENFEFIHGKITNVDTQKKLVTYLAKTSDGSSETTSESTSMVTYDSLVIALGSSGPSPLFSLHESHLPTLRAYEEMQKQVGSAQSILISGGGAAGTETAGEIGTLKGNSADITILSGAKHLLSKLKPSIGEEAERILKGKGVKTIHNVQVTSSKKLPNGKTSVSLSDGTKREVDVYIEAVGRKPNSSVLPESILDPSKRVISDNQTRVKGLDNVWAVGDIPTWSDGGLVSQEFATPIAVANIVATLKGEGEKNLKTYKPFQSDMQFVPIGPKTGVGALFGYSIPGWLVWLIKSRTFLFSKAPEPVVG